MQQPLAIYVAVQWREEKGGLKVHRVINILNMCRFSFASGLQVNLGSL